MQSEHLANFQRSVSKLHKTHVGYNNFITDKFCPNDIENIRDDEMENRYFYKKAKSAKKLKVLKALF